MKPSFARPFVWLVSIVSALAACTSDDVEPGPEAPPPTEEEIMLAWDGICDLYYSEVRVTRCLADDMPDLEALRQDCLASEHDLYYCMPGCVEPNYAAEVCLIDAHAELDYEEPLNEYYLCNLQATPGCEDLVSAADMVQCGGCDWSGTTDGTGQGSGT